MITPRTTRLLRAPDLHAFRDTLVDLARSGSPLEARDRIVLVPTRAAARHLVRSVEHRLPQGGASVLPDIITPRQLVGHFAQRLREPSPMLTDIDREVLFGAACREAAGAGEEPPFRLRPGLLAEMLRFYDALRRRLRDVRTFERLVLGILEPAAPIDRGAEGLVRQTRFLVSAFERFERRCGETGALDGPSLSARVLLETASRPWRHVVVAAGDESSEPLGLWPADWDLLARVPGLERLDVLVTDTVLAGALHERIHQLLPGIDEVHIPGQSGREGPQLVAPADGPAYRLRDREEEVTFLARWVRAEARGGRVTRLDRVGLVVRQPLPYVYLGRAVLGAAHLPSQASGTLPLAAEPFAAALDLVLAFAGTDFGRPAAVELLCSPHVDLGPVSRAEIAAFDRVLSEQGYLGGHDELARLVDDWEADGRPGRCEALRAGRLACRAASELLPLRAAAPTADHLATLARFFERHTELPGRDDPVRIRQLRARDAVLQTIRQLAGSFARWDAAPMTLDGLSSLLRRWIDEQTFAIDGSETGVQVVDAVSARFADFEHVQLAGLVEGEWPGPAERNIFYAPVILRELGWPSDADRQAAERAAFADLLGLADQTVRLSTFMLEDDALMTPSVLMDEVERAGLAIVERAPDLARVLEIEALGLTPIAAGALPQDVARTAAWRVAAAPARRSTRFRGTTEGCAPPAFSVSALERYQDCPFRYFARDVLRIDEPPDDDAGLSPRARGRLIHEVFQRFFDAWDRQHGNTITTAGLDEARALFDHVAEPMLAVLPAADAALERARLFGSAVAMGLVDVVLGLEAARPVRVVERWLEHRFDGAFRLGRSSGTPVPLAGVADRIDLLEGRRLRVIDYKSGAAPQATRALQVPVYALCAVDALEQRDGAPWTVDEAAYVAFTGRRTLVPVIRPGGAPDVLTSARERVLHAVDGVSSGAFPPRPHDPLICRSCAYPSVCRKDYVVDA